MEFLKPERILEQINLQGDETAADFGAGAGGFAIPLAQRLKDGRVYAFDIQREALSALESLAKSKRIYNIKSVVCDLEQERATKLADSSVDLALIANLLFQSKNHKAILTEASRILKKGGRLAIVDWREDYFFGPREGKISQKDLENSVFDCALDVVKKLDAGQSHFALLIEKP